MPKVLIRSIDDAPAVPLPPDMAGEGVTVQGVFVGEKQPLHLHRLAIAAGGWLEWQDGGRGQVAFVVDGRLQANGVTLKKGSTITVEHAASLRIAADADSDLLVFGQSAIGNTPEQGKGGHVHLLPAEDVSRRRCFDGFDYTGGAIFVDAACDSCALWLHEAVFHGRGKGVDIHRHSEDEIIVTLEGDLLLGNRRAGPGTAIFVAQNTLYGFDTGLGEVTFINFRPGSPTFTSADGTVENLDERAFYVQQLGHPAAHYFASPARQPAATESASG